MSGFYGCYGMGKAVVAVFIIAISVAAIASCSLVIQSLSSKQTCVLASEEMSAAATKSDSARYFKVSAEQVAEQMRLDWSILALHMAFSEYGNLLQRAFSKTSLGDCHAFCESTYTDQTKLLNCFRVCNQCHDPKDKWPKTINCSRFGFL